MVGIERGHSSPTLPAPLAPAPRHRQRQWAAAAATSPHHLGCHGASVGHGGAGGAPSQGGMLEAPSPSPLAAPPQVAFGICKHCGEGLGRSRPTPAGAFVLCGPPGAHFHPARALASLLSVPTALFPAPPACPSLQQPCGAHSCAPARHRPHPHPGGSCSIPGSQAVVCAAAPCSACGAALSLSPDGRCTPAQGGRAATIRVCAFPVHRAPHLRLAPAM